MNSYILTNAKGAQIIVRAPTCGEAMEIAETRYWKEGDGERVVKAAPYVGPIAAINSMIGALNFEFTKAG